MKIALAGLMLFSFQSFASSQCGPSDSYAESINLADGSTLFRNPGIYINGVLAYHLVCSEGNCLNSNVDEICRVHLGMSKGISLNSQQCKQYDCPIAFLKNGNYIFKTSFTDVITEITCK